MKLNKINMALLGTGRIGKIHLQNLLNIENVNLKYVYDVMIDEGLKNKLLARNIDVVDDDAKIFSDNEIDAIVICTPTNTHRHYIEKGINNKKHIFCEKPIANTLEDAKYLNELSQKNPDIKVQIGFNRRWDINFSTIKEKINNNFIGDLHIINVTSYDPGLPPLEYLKVSGGLFFDMTIHDFDMVSFLSDDDISAVFVQADALVDPKVKEVPDVDTAIIQLKLKNKKTLCTIINSRQAIYGYDQRVEVLGSKGALTTDNVRPNMVIWKNEDGITHEKPVHFFLERYAQSYQTEMETFINGIIEDKEVKPGVKEGYNAILVAKAAQQSLNENKMIYIKDIL